MGTLTNGIDTIAWNNPAAPNLDWAKSRRTTLDPILKDCVIVAADKDAKGFGHASIPDGTRMVALSDDKFEDSAVLRFSRAEFTKFAQGIKDGEFDHLMATEAELEAASALV